jgi:hypothetical protein
VALSNSLPSILLPPSLILVFAVVVAVPGVLVIRSFVNTVALSSGSEIEALPRLPLVGRIDLAYTRINRKTGQEQASSRKERYSHVIPTFS